MKKAWRAIHWLTFIGIPASLTYFTDFGGFATSLNDSLGSITPVLGALMPFGMIAIGSVSVIVGLRFLWNAVLHFLVKDQKTFRGCANAIRICKMGVVTLADTPGFMWDEGERLERYARVHTELVQLFNRLLALDVWVPGPVDLTNQQYQKGIIWYLATLESLAEEGNLEQARTIRKLPNIDSS